MRPLSHSTQPRGHIGPHVMFEAPGCSNSAVFLFCFVLFLPVKELKDLENLKWDRSPWRNLTDHTTNRSRQTQQVKKTFARRKTVSSPGTGTLWEVPLSDLGLVSLKKDSCVTCSDSALNWLNLPGTCWWETKAYRVVALSCQAWVSNGMGDWGRKDHLGN